MDTKFCRHCKTKHPLTKEFWCVDKRKTSGLGQCKVYKSDWRIENREKLRIQENRRYHSNKKHILSKMKEYREKNIDKIKERKRIYSKNNKEVINRWHRNKMENDINFKISRHLRSRLWRLIKNNENGSAVRNLGCTISELKQYLESKFQPGMTWDNWSRKGWHIDHITALSKFDLTCPEQLRKACHYTNLQPLWAKDNLSKGAK